MNESNEVEPWMVLETLAEHLAPLLEQYDVKDRGHGIIYVDHQYYNIETSQRILVSLSASLGVPVQRVRSRLINVGWLKDIRSSRSTRDDVTLIIEQMTTWEAAGQEDNFQE
ncbi:hypothetical protein [Pseudomonas syringae]|uniref:hypothetical protein n=1 Tax=Pseudomonas syringae TaxID=317 RepID=UPI0002099164|nr:hypothetical protein [Pseudomonas syringae]MBS7473938.1 hypothetical protein [Pseudomonas syringae]MCF8982776.1 hypothetical protein [Pseudomonas syringae]MCK9739071.1 hypothetical protein [Pseudomonas syringae pv. syringae]MDP5166718.1 hypothetical protein [Pseudomonas syringae pv. aptata str. DSM 50252]PIO94304.1 hypothetical protein CBI55_08380 [Pseudomonas syringae]